MKQDLLHTHSEISKDTSSIGNRILLFPILVILSVLPLIIRSYVYEPDIVQYPWYNGAAKTADIFLFYKQWIFVGLGGIMLFILILKACVSNQKLLFHKIFLPLIVYLIFAIISAGTSPYVKYTTAGLYDRFENVYALFTYGIVVYYIYIFINKENDLKLMMRFLFVGVFGISVFGIAQLLGHDLLKNPFVQKLYLSKEILDSIENLTFNFEEGRIFATLFNSNYVGVYTAMMIPLLICFVYFSKKKWKTVVSMAALAGMILCLVGSKSKAGMIAVAVSCILVLIFLRKQMIKKWYITVMGVAAVILILVLPQSPVNFKNIVDALKNSDTTDVLLEDIHTDEQYVHLTYKGHSVSIAMRSIGNDFGGFTTIDEDGKLIDQYSQTEGTNIFSIMDERYSDLMLEPLSFGSFIGFTITINGTSWAFTNQIDNSGKYYFINQNAHATDIKTADSAIFTEHNNALSSRGFIWSRTIPMLKKTIVKGIGPNVFAFEFPYTDYVGYYNSGFYGQMINKPHSWYLQMGVETGIPSLIAVLVLYIMYAISSVKLYRRNEFTSYSSCLGVGIFIAITSYMIMGITNDSFITVAPVFWALFGIGIAINYKFLAVSTD